VAYVVTVTETRTQAQAAGEPSLQCEQTASAAGRMAGGADGGDHPAVKDAPRHGAGAGGGRGSHAHAGPGKAAAVVGTRTRFSQRRSVPTAKAAPPSPPPPPPPPTPPTPTPPPQQQQQQQTVARWGLKKRYSEWVQLQKRTKVMPAARPPACLPTYLSVTHYTTRTRVNLPTYPPAYLP
jgi:hypothetical protein